MNFRNKSNSEQMPGAVNASDRELNGHAEQDHLSLVGALTSVDSRSDLAVTRTRRRVYSTVVDMEEQRQRRSRQKRLAVCICAVLVTVLAPAVWSSVVNFSEGAHFSDLQTQISLLPMMLFPGIVAVATASYLHHHKR